MLHLCFIHVLNRVPAENYPLHGGVFPNGYSSSIHTVLCNILECVKEVPTSILSMDF